VIHPGVSRSLMVKGQPVSNVDGVWIVLGFFQLHFLRTGLQSVDDPELAWAGVSQLGFLLSRQRIVFILIQKENGVEKSKLLQKSQT